MNLLLACFPLCTTFAALTLLLAALLIAGVGRTDADEIVEVVHQPRQYPAWWTIALIPVVIAIVLGLLAWATMGN